MDAQQLFDANIGIARHVMKEFEKRTMPRGADRDDMHQVALMGLWAACQPGKFDPLHGQVFATYAGGCVRHELLRWFGDAMAQKRGPHVPHCQLDPEYPLMSRDPSPSRRLEEQEREATVHRIAMNVLRYFGEKRRVVLRSRYLDGKSWPEIATEFGYANGGSACKATWHKVLKFRKRHKRVIANAQASLHRGSDQ